MGRGGMADAGRLDGAAVPRPAGGVLVPGDQPAGRVAVPWRRGGTGPVCPQLRRVGRELFAHSHPALHPHGRSAVPHGARRESDRRRRAPDPPGSGTARGGRGGRGHGVLGDLGLDHRDYRDAREPDAAGDARARVSPYHGDRPADGDRRGGHADPALRAYRAAREPFGYLDLQAPDRRHRSGTNPQRSLRGVHRGARKDESVARARGKLHRIPRLGKAAAVHSVRRAAGLDFRRRGRFHVRRLGHADRIGRDRRAFHHLAGRGLPGDYRRQPAQGAARHGEHIRNDPVHHRRRDDLLADPVFFRSEQRHGRDHRHARPAAARAHRRDDARPDLPRPLRRAGQHDDDHAPHLHAAGPEIRGRPGVVRRDVPHLHAARLAAAAAWAPPHDHEGRIAAAGHDGTHLPGGCALHLHEPARAGAGVLRARSRGVAPRRFSSPRIAMERSFTKEVELLKLGAGQTFHGEGILAVTKALLQSGVSYVGGYHGAPVSHVMDVLNDARGIMDELGIHIETNASEAGAAAMLGASINYPLRGAVAWKSTVGTNVASDALSNLSSAGVRGGALIVIGEDYAEGASIIQERSHAFAMKSQIWLLDPRPDLPAIVRMDEKGFELSEASNTPVMLELRIRACHLHGSFAARENRAAEFSRKNTLENPDFDFGRISLPPATYAQEKQKIEVRWPAAVKFIREHRLNEVFDGTIAEVGIITQGGMYNAAVRALQQLGLADAFGNSKIPIYALNVTYPLVPEEVNAFCAGKRAVLMVEEGQPAYLED